MGAKVGKSENIEIYKTTILSFVLYGCKTWSLTLSEKDVLWVFKNTDLNEMKKEEAG
jgi:hypothetical protein